MCPYLLPRIVFSIVPCIPSTAQRSMCELIFGKDQRDENWPFTTSHKNVAVRIQHRHLSHVVRSCRTTRHSPFFAPVMESLTPVLDHPRRAERSMNGLKCGTGAPTPFQHVVAPLTHIGAQQNLPVCSHGRLQARHRPRWRGYHGRATPLNGRRLISRHRRVAWRDTTVPDSTWHGVSGRGASEA